MRNGSVIAAGYTENDPGIANWEARGLLVKYSTSHGTFRWDRECVDQLDPKASAGWSLVGIDAKGRAAVAGWENLDAVGSGDEAWITCVYSAAGTQRPLVGMAGTAAGSNYPTALASTADGHVYETGHFTNAGQGQDVCTLALNRAATLLWYGVLDDAMHSWDGGFGVVTTSKAVYVAGYMYTSLAVAKYAR